MITERISASFCHFQFDLICMLIARWPQYQQALYSEMLTYLEIRFLEIHFQGRRNFLITPLNIDLHICCPNWVICLVRPILVTGKQNEGTMIGSDQLEITFNSGIRIHSLKAHFFVRSVDICTVLGFTERRSM